MSKECVAGASRSYTVSSSAALSEKAASSNTSSLIMVIESTTGWITIAAMQLRLAFIALSFAGLMAGAENIPAASAKDHLNETGTVCGKVVSTRYLDQSNKMTFLNFDKPYPESPFTAV